MTTGSTVTITMQLLDEGTPTARPVQAVPLGNGLYKVQPTPNYDPETETWEFPPGSVVRCERIDHEYFGDVFLAVEKIG